MIIYGLERTEILLWCKRSDYYTLVSKRKTAELWAYTNQNNIHQSTLTQFAQRQKKWMDIHLVQD